MIDICKNEEQGEMILEAVNFNSPGQVVIAGSKIYFREIIRKL